MQRALGRTLALAAAFLAFSACNDDTGISTVTPPPVPTVISATGDITAKVVEYRALCRRRARCWAARSTAHPPSPSSRPGRALAARSLAPSGGPLVWNGIAAVAVWRLEAWRVYSRVGGLSVNAVAGGAGAEVAGA